MSEVKNLDKLKKLLVTIEPNLSSKDISQILEGALFFLIKELQDMKAREKGDPGDPGKPGDKGDSYVLTERDKKQIAKSIEVPVVEKIVKEREIVVEKPIELIREKTLETITKDEPAESLRDKLESLKGDERLDKSAIKGLEDLYTVNKPVFQIGGRRGMVVRRVSLTSQCNGITKAFTMPIDTRDVIGIWGTQFPITFDPNDWTFSGRTLTIGNDVGAPETGQTLWALIESM
jgi:hypothetical protein